MKFFPYSKFRQIMGIPLTNGNVRTVVGDLIANGGLDLTDMELLQSIYEMEVDSDILRIITDRDPAEIDTFEAAEVLVDFFGYCRANWPKLASLLGSMGIGVAIATTHSSGLK